MADDEAPELLSPELAASLGTSGGDGMFLSAKKKQKPGGGGGGGKHGPRRANALPVVKKLSKNQKRKLAKVEEDKRKRERRAGVVARLNAAKLVSDESLQLLRGSDRMGQRMSKRETLRRELKAERAGISLPGTENSRLLKRERPADAFPDGVGGDEPSSSDDDDDDGDGDGQTFGKKRSWPCAPATPSSTVPPAESYGPVHPLDQARLDAERIERAESRVYASSDDDDDDPDDDETLDEITAREKFSAALRAARVLSEEIRRKDPEQRTEKEIALLGPNASAALLDPKDANAKMAAANEAASRAASLRYPGVFVGASRSVSTNRDESMQTSREGLPISSHEHDIVDAINCNPIVVICGETGCGKTTQVPQFLYEAGYGDPSCVAHPGAVAVTQPRRVAVTSTATRVAKELNLPLGGDVGYQVRYDKKIGRNPRIKFMTDGILLREMQSDVLLRAYSVVIVDEAHERGVNTDILLGLLSRIVPLRAELTREGRKGITPLRLVVMSATLRVEEFVENKKLCPTPPALLRVAARQFPVTVHFARETAHGDYLSAAKKKVLAIHRKLPPGGILVFLTGQREVDQLVAKLRQAYPTPSARSGDDAENDDAENDDAEKDDDAPAEGLDAFGADVFDAAGEAIDCDPDADGNEERFDDVSDEDSQSDVSEEENVVVHGGEGVGPEEAAEAEAAWARAHAPFDRIQNEQSRDRTIEKRGNDASETGPGYLHVLPLYAMLPPHLQRRVFEPPPEGARVVVVATNVAETSLTIPNTRYVVDAGREKRRLFGMSPSDRSRDGKDDSVEDAAAQSAGMSRFAVGWISKASAEQRAGRAGRTGPGHCYRLFSSAHFVNDLEPHAPPAILAVPVDGVVLQMRAMGIDKVHRFPFLTPPDPGALRRAQRTLVILGAIRRTTSGGSGSGSAAAETFGSFGNLGDDDDVGVLTETGKAMASLPVGPRHARMLLAAAFSEIPGCLAAAVAATAALSLDSPFLRSGTAEAGGGGGGGGGEDVSDVVAFRGKARRGFLHPRSDALSAARALVAYDDAQNDVQNGGGPRAAERFCLEHGLHSRTMREASDLRKQLLRALSAPSASRAFPAAARAELAAARAYSTARRGARGEKRREDPASGALRVAGEAPRSGSSRSNANDESPGDVALRRALLTGWADRVARRIKAHEVSAGDGADGDAKRTRATRYKPALVHSTVYLHPSSSLHKTSPEYVVYVDIARTEKRAYLTGATAADAAWLCEDASALTSVSPPLDDPPPRYVASKGIVVGFSQPHFGKHRWVLPLRTETLTAERGGCGAFAAAVLSGAVSRPLAELREKLAAKPALCARPEGKTQRRVGELIHALRRRNVACREDLVREWTRDPAYLMVQVRDWMKRGHEHVLERAWPRVVAGALFSGSPSRGGGGGGGTDSGGTAIASQGTVPRLGAGAGLEKKASSAEPFSFSGVENAKKKKKRRSVNPAALDGGLSIWD